MKKEHAKFLVVVALHLATPGSNSKVFAGTGKVKQS